MKDREIAEKVIEDWANTSLGNMTNLIENAFKSVRQKERERCAEIANKLAWSGHSTPGPAIAKAIEQKYLENPNDE